MMAADYRHIGGRENRLGRHYSRFSPFWPTPALAGQSLALRKLCDAGSNRRSQARGTGNAPGASGLAQRYQPRGVISGTNRQLALLIGVARGRAKDRGSRSFHRATATTDLRNALN